nr:hypothetical protein [Tanacetum cinerariifolium]
MMWCGRLWWWCVVLEGVGCDEEMVTRWRCDVCRGGGVKWKCWVAVMMVAVAAMVRTKGGVAARDGECCGKSCRSEGGGCFWGSPKKFFGGGGGGRRLAGGGRKFKNNQQEYNSLRLVMKIYSRD